MTADVGLTEQIALRLSAELRAAVDARTDLGRRTSERVRALIEIALEHAGEAAPVALVDVGVAAPARGDDWFQLSAQDLEHLDSLPGEDRAAKLHRMFGRDRFEQERRRVKLELERIEKERQAELQRQHEALYGKAEPVVERWTQGEECQTPPALLDAGQEWAL